VVVVSAKVESELNGMPAEEAAEWLDMLGVEAGEGGGLAALIRATYKTLGLQTYFTTGRHLAAAHCVSCSCWQAAVSSYTARPRTWQVALWWSSSWQMSRVANACLLIITCVCSSSASLTADSAATTGACCRLRTRAILAAAPSYAHNPTHPCTCCALDVRTRCRREGNTSLDDSCGHDGAAGCWRYPHGFRARFHPCRNHWLQRLHQPQGLQRCKGGWCFAARRQGVHRERGRCLVVPIQCVTHSRSLFHSLAQPAMTTSPT